MSGLRGDDGFRELLVLAELERGFCGEAGGLVDGGEQFVQINGFGEVIHGAIADGVHGIADVGIGGDEEDGEPGVLFAGEAQGFESGDAGHADIGDHHV